MKFSSLIVFLFLLTSLGGCNTTRGFGEDVEATGEGIQNAAEAVEEDLQD